MSSSRLKGSGVIEITGNLGFHVCTALLHVTEWCTTVKHGIIDILDQTG